MTDVSEKSLISSIARNKKQGQKFAFLLGAGASISSGINGAGDLARKWLKELSETDQVGYKNIIQDEAFDENNVAACYTKIYQARFQHFPHDGYQEIEAIMTDEKVHPSFGYTVLAQVLTETRHNIVLTTNFDRLTETALLVYRNTHGKVVVHEGMLSQTDVYDDKPSIYKIHRDMHFAPISEEKGVDELDVQWEQFIQLILKQYNIVCLGYGGNDNGLMNMLAEQLQVAKNANIYWCYRGNEKPVFGQFKAGCEEQVKLVKIAGFDEFMLRLNRALEFKSIEEQIKEISKKRQQLEQEAIKLVASIAKGGDLEEAKELVAETWWEVQVAVDNTEDDDEKDQLYQQGLLKFPDSHQLMGNYAAFLLDRLKKYDKAERYFTTALELNPDDVYTLANFSELYLQQGRFSEAEPYLDKSEKLNTDSKFQLVLAFYRLALFPDYYQKSKGLILELLAQGYTNLDCEFSGIIEQAEKQGNTKIEELQHFADRIYGK